MPWRIGSAQAGSRHPGHELNFQGSCFALVAVYNFYLAFVRLIDGKAWLGVCYLAVGLLFALVAARYFLEFRNRRRARRHEEGLNRLP